jgi:hypothetical protein
LGDLKRLEVAGKASAFTWAFADSSFRATLAPIHLAGLLGAKPALTAESAVRLTLYLVRLPRHTPSQPVNRLPGVGTARSPVGLS